MGGLETARRQLADNRELTASDEGDSPRWHGRKFPRSEKRVPISNWHCSSRFCSRRKRHRNAIVEIRAGTGGSEAAIFAGRSYPHVQYVMRKRQD